MGSTRLTFHLDADRARVYAAFLDAEAVGRWRVPAGMSCEVHEFEGREGGAVRVSLTYDAQDARGKTTRNVDTYHGRFVRLVPDELVVEVDEFETTDPALGGEMTITIRLTDSPGGGTDLAVVHEGLPDGVPTEDNELGWRESLSRLAALLGGG
ncbi:SRPBCC family protein [Nocardioides sp. LHG3406-4]|uniref:SRPBCC family protein n=1 Tax=Nocardioides sp. LHG3406-4 TaxID=2804575 RepID=UPI003CFA48BC